ncbi:MAG: acetate uptake transporter [Candidatus Thermoplasmatota archaeon]|jgi:succinate-acetate transporter protein|nr:acetate uptake transporter [Candidatus Thermoplasmatota archaeon]MCL5789603.1 acetate uptake transporter [Candidatus Thermoplasmatota archaeon]
MSEEVKKGDPTALGIFAYGFGLMILSLYALGVYNWGEHLTLMAPALVFSGLFLLVAANWEYNNGNTFGATAFGTYSGFFLTFAVLSFALKLGWVTDVEHAHLVGMMALAFVFMTFIYWVGSFKMTLVHNLMLFVLLITFILWALPLLSMTDASTTILGKMPGAVFPAGVAGIIDVVFTTYLAGAVVINDRWVNAGSRPPLPLFPLGKKTVKTNQPVTHPGK